MVDIIPRGFERKPTGKKQIHGMGSKEEFGVLFKSMAEEIWYKM